MPYEFTLGNTWMVEHQVSFLVSLTGDLNAQIFDEATGRLRSRRIHIFTLVTFARTAYWPT